MDTTIIRSQVPARHDKVVAWVRTLHVKTFQGYPNPDAGLGQGADRVGGFGVYPGAASAKRCTQ